MRWLLLGVILVGASPRSAEARDVLHFVNGEPVNCEVIEITDKIVRVRLSIEVAGGQAFSTKIFSRNDVAVIDFGPLPGETLLLESAGLEDLAALEELWDLKRANIALPNSNAGEVGILYGEVLLGSEGRLAPTRAKELFTKIETSDWNEARRLRARQGRLRTLLVMGEIEEAIAEATRLASETQDDAILAEAEFILATADFNKLRVLVDENPRWIEDDEVRPLRDALYHDVMDRFLRPYLFQGSDEEAAARGLWSAVEVYLSADKEAAAVQRAEDIVALYPGSSYAGRAREMLKKSVGTEEVPVLNDDVEEKENDEEGSDQ